MHANISIMVLWATAGARLPLRFYQHPSSELHTFNFVSNFTSLFAFHSLFNYIPSSFDTCAQMTASGEERFSYQQPCMCRHLDNMYIIFSIQISDSLINLQTFNLAELDLYYKQLLFALTLQRPTV